MRKLLLTFLVSLYLPACARQAIDAGTALELELEELAQRAALIIEGRVLTATPQRSASGRIDTEFTLATDRTYWGEARPVWTVRIPGGVLEEDGDPDVPVGTVIPGLAQLRQGEDVLLLLSDESTADHATGLRIPIGLAQGQLRRLTRSDGRRVFVRSQGALSLVVPATGGELGVTRHANGIDVIDYAEAVARIAVGVARKSSSESGRNEDW